MAREHNHALLAARTTIQQNQAQETTANLRPNPVLLGDAQFLPFFSWDNFNGDYFQNNAQFDVGLSYLFERGDKRRHRLQAARDQTAVTTAQVSDTERTLTFNVASQFIAALLAQSNLAFAEQNLTSFQQTVNVSQERFDAGAASQGDLLKIKIQLLQFQMDVSSARLARVQALATLRQLLGYESVPEDYEVSRRARAISRSRSAGRTEGARPAATSGPARGAARRRSCSEPTRAWRARTASATSPRRRATRTSPPRTPARSSATSRCRSSIAIRAKSLAPGSPSHSLRSLPASNRRS